MKGKTILGVALTLMLMASMLSFAVPVSAKTLAWDVEWDEGDFEIELGTDVTDLAVAEGGLVIYAATGIASLGAWSDEVDGGNTWNATGSVNGTYSARLVRSDAGTGSVYLEFVPDPGITVADLDDIGADDPEWSFWYYLQSGWGPQLELKFTDPDSAGYVEVTLMALQATTNFDDWFKLEVLDNIPRAIYYGVDIDGTTSFAWDGTSVFELDDMETEINADVTGTAGDWELTRVRLELWEPADTGTRYCCIDDVTIDGTTYQIEAQLYVSKNGGESWDESVVVEDTAIISACFVAVSPDDPQYLAVANSKGIVYISDDGSSTWDTLGDCGVDHVADIDISVEKDGKHFVAVVGDDGAHTAEVVYYEIGAIGAEWKDMTTGDISAGFTTGNITADVAFSPNFVSDEIMLVVTADTIVDTIDFQMFSFNQDVWNAEAGFDDYPVDIVGDTSDNFTRLDAASISPAPDYLGSDDALRMVFVGIATDQANETSGIFRLDDDDVDTLKDEEFIYSVAYDGTNLVAGDYSDTTVYRCADPLASDPSVSGSAGSKSPGGDERTLVAWAGDEVAAGTFGNESGFSISRNNGKTFQDLSLIDTGFGTMSDMAVSPDGLTMYLVTADGDSDLSLWRYADELWQRVYSDQDASSDYIVRIAPDDADVVYIADASGDGTAIYYSADGGEDRWQTRTSRYDIIDLAVETDGDVCYVLTTSGYVSKSTNTGFSWGTKETTEQSGSNMILSLGEDLVLVGGSPGASYVSYSTDGNESWDDLDELDKSGYVQIAASGLTTADFIFASTDYSGGDDIYRWDWADDEWDSIYDDAGIITGMGLANGTLYVISSDNGTWRTLEPFADDVDDWDLATTTAVFDRTPSALRISSGTSTLWAIDTDTQALYGYDDTLMVAMPMLRAPTHGTSVPVNPVTGRSFDLSFSWECPSDDVEAFVIKIALDEGFDEEVLGATIEESADEGDIISQVIGPNAAGDFEMEFMPETTYYWKVKVSEPVLSPYSVVYTFSVEEAVAPYPEVTVEAPAAPEVTVTPAPAPQVTVEVPPAPTPVAAPPAIPAYLLWTIIIIGAVLVIALIVLIVRTRRVV